jgi:hypothetical protein
LSHSARPTRDADAPAGQSHYPRRSILIAGSRVASTLIAEATHVARRAVTAFVDDIDGSPAGETVLFTLDGVSYEVDLSRPHPPVRSRAVRGGQRLITAIDPK